MQCLWLPNWITVVCEELLEEAAKLWTNTCPIAAGVNRQSRCEKAFVLKLRHVEDANPALLFQGLGKIESQGACKAPVAHSING